MLTQNEFLERFKLSEAELEDFVAKGFITPTRSDDHFTYDHIAILRMAVIVSSTEMGFTLEETRRFLRLSEYDG